MEMRDLYRFAKLEADRHRSNNHNGSTTCDWNQQNWWRWATDKLMEHVKGEVCWQQFGSEKFGVLESDQSLKESILTRYDGLAEQDRVSNDEMMEFYDELNGLLAS